MNYHIIINNVKSVDELQNAWSNDDYIELLNRFGFDGAESSEASELLELLFILGDTSIL